MTIREIIQSASDAFGYPTSQERDQAVKAVRLAVEKAENALAKLDPSQTENRAFVAKVGPYKAEYFKCDKGETCTLTYTAEGVKAERLIYVSLPSVKFVR